MRHIVVLVWCAIGCSSSPPSLPTAADCEHVYGTPSGYGATACCRTSADCVAAGQAAYSCVQPGTPLPYGNCPLSDCAIDADCQMTSSTAICQPLGCTPPFGMGMPGQCTSGCTNDAGCSDGESCDTSTHRCAPSACAQTSDCPVDFTCGGFHCARTTCTDSSQCAGFCVDGQCFATAGECQGPVG